MGTIAEFEAPATRETQAAGFRTTSTCTPST